MILFGSFFTLIAVDGVVASILENSSGFFSSAQLGILTGWLMVLPNALLAFYYAWKRRADVVYSSQIGDGHICIPLCIGLFAFFEPIPVSEVLAMGMVRIAGLGARHLFCVLFIQRLPKFVGVGLILGYGYLLYNQLN